MKIGKIATYLSASVAAIAIIAPASASAQQQEAGAPLAQNARSVIDEIVVTARREEESLQEVPIAVTALSGSFLDEQNIVDASSLSQFVPSLSILAQPVSPTAASIFIRGIGSQLPNANAEHGVGVYIDGVYLARAAGVLFDQVDLERIEVLRGPQGTLFGRNTIGGAVQLVTRKPSNEMGAEVKAGFGRYNDAMIRARFDTGYLGNSNIKMSVAGMHRQRDGYVDNLLQPNSRDPGSVNADAVMVKVQGDFGRLTANYDFDYSERRSSPPYFQMIDATPLVREYFGRSAGLGGDPFIVSPTRLGTGYENGFVDSGGVTHDSATAKISGHALTLRFDASDDLTLNSITAYREFTQDTFFSLDGQGNLLGRVIDFTSPTFTSVKPVAFLNGKHPDQDQWQFSQELQALGSVGNVSYIVGAYYFKEKATENVSQAITLPIPVANLTFYGFGQPIVDAIVAANPGLGIVGLNVTPRKYSRPGSESIALYGQVNWQVTDQFALTGGLRYTHDKKTITQTLNPTPANMGEETYNNVSWLLSANYEVTDDVMVYARVSTGYRSGGFVIGTGVVDPPYAPETVTAYEIGLKSDFFDRRLRLNLAAYYTDYKDLQISQFRAGTGGVISDVVNAASVVMKGIEAEIVAVPAEGLTFDGSLGYIDDNFKQFDYRDPTTNQIINIASEVRLPHAPNFNAHVGGQYEMPLGTMMLKLRGDYSYRSTVYFHSIDRTAPFNQAIRSRPDHNVRARLSLSDIDVAGGRMEIGLWGNNLTNDVNIDFAIDYASLGAGAASFKQPRTYGIDAKLTF